MNTNDLLLKDEVFKIVGGAFEMLNTIGHGLHEKIYEKRLGEGSSLIRVYWCSFVVK